MADLATSAPAISAAFLASLVEVVEAFTIVLAIAVLNGWRPAVLGTAAALAVLAALVALLGPLLGLVPIHILQLVVGVLLLLFGAGWLRKAALRAAGVIALHDEDAVFRSEMGRGRVRDVVAGIAAFKAVLLEGLEVAFIVVSVGSGRGLIGAASLGALAATVVVLAVGAVARRPLARVPENTLKFGVGVMLTAFGVFWTGEGLDIDWPGADLALVPLMALFLAVGLLAARLARHTRGAVA